VNKKTKNILKLVDQAVNKYNKAIAGVSIVVLILVIVCLKVRISHELVLVVALCFSMLFKQGKKFLKEWGLFIVMYLVYEILSGQVSYIHTFLNIQTRKTALLDWERVLFGERIPTLWMQDLVKEYPTVIDYVSFFVYTSSFWMLIAVGYLLFTKSRDLFRRYKYSYLIVTYMGYITYIFFPAYPPWIAANEGILPHLDRPVWEVLAVGREFTTIISKLGYNAYAPFPSLHTAWSIITSYYLYQLFKNKIGKLAYLFFGYTILMILVIIILLMQ